MGFLKINLFTMFITLALSFIGCNSSDINNPIKNNESKYPPYLISFNKLEQTSQDYRSKKEPVFTYGKILISEADMWLDSSYYTITNRKHLPASGNKHDYYSIGPYWWPDLSKEGGKPYIRKDGYRNPETLEYDSPKLKNMVSAVKNLTIAFILTEDEKYKNKALGFIKTWFIDPETKMNPHLEYGQAIPGINDGRGIGIIETRRLVEVVDAIGILYRKDALTKGNYQELQSWFNEYNIWLTTSEKGIAEKNWHNNHGSAYDLQVLAFSLFTENKLMAINVLDSVTSKRIDKHIESNGSQPFELERTKAFSYSIFNLKLLVEIALLAERLDRNLWDYESYDGRSIQKAIQFLIPFLFEGKEWTYPQMVKLEDLKYVFFELLNMANGKNDALNYDRYIFSYDFNSKLLQKEVLLRPIYFRPTLN